MKKRLSALLAVVMLLAISMTASAKESTTDTHIKPLVNPIAETIEVKEPRVPNGIPITSSPRRDGTGIDVHVGNIGVDGLDSVTVVVSATGYGQTKSLTAYVPAGVGKTFSFDFPYIKCATPYNITIYIVDGSGNQTLHRSAQLIYTEEILAAIGWGAGTYATRALSLENHFNKHHNDGGVGVNKLVSYLLWRLTRLMIHYTIPVTIRLFSRHQNLDLNRHTNTRINQRDYSLFMETIQILFILLEVDNGEVQMPLLWV